jgi:membrane protein YdbS with pleckstrin-like domain
MQRSEPLTQWVYQGIWGFLTRWFRVPQKPPTLPVASKKHVESFRPAEGFLRYLKFQFWIVLLLIDLAILVGWIVITAASPVAGAVLAVPALLIAVVPDMVAYIAIHLRYDTTWYVMSDRSLRIRRGIWIIRETTITFENVQNVKVTQGPLQRWFGIGTVLVETAGGGGHTAEAGHGSSSMGSHQGLIEGIANTTEIRDRILQRVRRSRTAGLGDEQDTHIAVQPAWKPAHLELLREISGLLRSYARRQNGPSP